MLKDEGGMIDFQLFACQQTDEQMHIGDCRVTFTTENQGQFWNLLVMRIPKPLLIFYIINFLHIFFGIGQVLTSSAQSKSQLSIKWITASN